VLITLVRHGETEWNRERRIQGSTDIPLNETGRLQAFMAAELLRRRAWSAVYTSPLSRAAETAEVIARELGVRAPIPVAQLVERHYGEAEGLSDTELAARYPDGAIVPGREPRDQLTARVMSALTGIARDHPDDAVIVVSHGGVIRTVLDTVDPSGHHGRISNASIHSFDFGSDGWRLIAFDDRLDEQSEALGRAPLVDQNALERPESDTPDDRSSP
jgi:probable phosphoglycerate mutase